LAPGTLDPAVVAKAAARLSRAASERRPISPLTDDMPDLTVDNAYAIQQAVADARLEHGEQLIGWKLGLTSKAMQDQLKVNQPDYGPLLSGHLVDDGSVIARQDLIAPRVEAEVAFVLKRALRGPGIDRDDVIAATAYLSAAIEVIDSRITDWRIHLADTIADMASCARIVVSAKQVPLDGLEARDIAVVLFRNGTAVAEGTGAAVLGDPIEAVAWAANTLGRFGVTLQPGQILMPGAMHASQPVVSGDVFEARFTSLGAVSVRFA
jgi:2-oxopent-4-enoate hydratase